MSLQSTVAKSSAAVALLLLTIGYAALAGREYLAARFAGRNDLHGLQTAVWLEPGNAEYRYQLGRYFWFVERSAESAIPPYQATLQLNPFEARAWFDLAAVYQFLGDSNRQEDALRHAVEEAPSTPDVAWEAGNMYAVRGETDKALKEFRVVLENDPYRPPAALRICWRIDPDIDVLLQDVVPPIPSVYSSFLSFLVAKKEPAAAAKVWGAMVQLGQPIERRYLFQYIDSLLNAGDVDHAQQGWQQAANLCDLSAYQPSSENLVINGDFSLDVLDGGLGWIYHQSRDVSLALDPTQPHTANRSLRIVFDSRGLEDSGIDQFIPVRPKTEYEFSANFRTEDLEGAGGPRFVLQDAYSRNIYLATDFLRDADFWKNVGGVFTTPAETRLLVLRVQRFPTGSPIKGKLWIDGVRLKIHHDDSGANH